MKFLELEAYKMAREQAKKKVYTPPELREIENKLNLRRNNMKYTIEVTPNGITKTFEFEGQKFTETWVKEDYSRHTTGKGITSQLEDKGMFEDYPDLLEALDLDELDDLWDEMRYFECLE
ncbi:MAG: hypothetical protein GX638_03220 [Crenarchaeota archaeon]|nr:hypothetical protein [Thermoproteota archaeon]